MKQAILVILGLICQMGAVAFVVAGTQIALTDATVGLQLYGMAAISGFAGVMGIVYAVREA